MVDSVIGRGSTDRILTVKEISEHDLLRFKENCINFTRALKQKDSHPKSKKNWMDGFYFGRPKITPRKITKLDIFIWVLEGKIEKGKRG